MNSYSSRFHVNIGQLQTLLALLYDTLAPQLPRSCHERVEEILAEPSGDEKALPLKPDRVIRSGDLVVGGRYRIVAIAPWDDYPIHAVDDVITCIEDSSGIPEGDTINPRQGWYARPLMSWVASRGSVEGGTYVTAVELVEDDADQPEKSDEQSRVGDRIHEAVSQQTEVVPERADIDNAQRSAGHGASESLPRAVQPVSSAPLRKQVDPTIIHAAEDIVLEPGEYEDTSTLGRQFTILGRVPSVKHCGVWVFILMPDGAAQGITVTAVRRVESKAPQESSPAGSAGTCDGTNGAASGPVAQQPAQPAGESQPEGECASSVATTLNDWHRVNAERQHEAFAPPHPLMALVACVQEEVGELAGAVLGVTGEKKRKAHKTRDDVLDAVADAMTYLSLIATNQGCDDLEKLLGDVFNMVSERAGSKLRTGLGQPLKTTEVARVYKERAEKAEQESSLQRDRAKRAELRLEQAERECAELRSELELLKEAESSISRSFAAYRNEAMGRSDAASHAVKELTEKLATYEREAKAWEVIERYRESQGDADVVIHFQHNSASSPAIRIGAFSETGISRLAAWCESQLNKESE